MYHTSIMLMSISLCEACNKLSTPLRSAVQIRAACSGQPYPHECTASSRWFWKTNNHYISSHLFSFPTLLTDLKSHDTLTNEDFCVHHVSACRYKISPPAQMKP